MIQNVFLPALNDYCFNDYTFFFSKTMQCLTQKVVMDVLRCVFPNYFINRNKGHGPITSLTFPVVTFFYGSVTSFSKSTSKV